MPFGLAGYGYIGLAITGGLIALKIFRNLNKVKIHDIRKEVLEAGV